MLLCIVTYFTLKKGIWDKYTAYLGERKLWERMFKKYNIKQVITGHKDRNSVLSIGFWNSLEDVNSWLISQQRNDLFDEYRQYSGDTFIYEIDWDRKIVSLPFREAIIRVARYSIKKGDQNKISKITLETQTPIFLKKYGVYRDISVKSLDNAKIGASISLWRSKEAIRKFMSLERGKSPIDRFMVGWDIREFELIAIRETIE